MTLVQLEEALDLALDMGRLEVAKRLRERIREPSMKADPVKLADAEARERAGVLADYFATVRDAIDGGARDSESLRLITRRTWDAFMLAVHPELRDYAPKERLRSVLFYALEYGSQHASAAIDWSDYRDADAEQRTKREGEAATAFAKLQLLTAFPNAHLARAALLLVGVELGRRCAELHLCPEHAAAAVQVRGHVGLLAFGVAARNVGVRATVASIPRARRSDGARGSHHRG